MRVVVVVVIVSVAVAWHMGEYVATSSNAMVVVVKRGTMALVLLMGSVKEIRLALVQPSPAKLMRQSEMRLAVTVVPRRRFWPLSGDGRTQAEDLFDWLNE
jgi:hypothetical protein